MDLLESLLATAKMPPHGQETSRTKYLSIWKWNASRTAFQPLDNLLDSSRIIREGRVVLLIDLDQPPIQRRVNVFGRPPHWRHSPRKIHCVEASGEKRKVGHRNPAAKRLANKYELDPVEAQPNGFEVGHN